MRNVEHIKSLILYISKNLLRLGAFLFLICVLLQGVVRVDNEFENSYGLAKEAIVIGGILLIVYLIVVAISRKRTRDK